MRRLLLVGAFFFAATTIAQTARPKITGIAYVRFHSSDAQGAASFYANLLGARHLHPTSQSDEYLLSSTQAIFIDRSPAPPPELEEEIGLEVSSTRQMKAYLREHHIKDMRERNDGGFSIQGPEGKRIAFVTRGLHTKSDKVAQPVHAEAVSTRIIHVGFVVHDRAAADAFFRDLLGFKLYWTGGPSWDGTPEHINYASMQVPDGREWVEYMLNRPPDMTARQYGSANHVALGVASIQDAVKKLRANGWTGTAEPRQGQDGKWQINLFDPDGTRIELMEFAPTREPCCTKYQRPHPSPSDR